MCLFHAIFKQSRPQRASTAQRAFKDLHRGLRDRHCQRLRKKGCPMTEVYVCDYIRTPIGRFGGALSSVRTDDLAALPIKALMARHPSLDWHAVDEVILGCANQAGAPRSRLASHLRRARLARRGAQGRVERRRRQRGRQGEEDEEEAQVEANGGRRGARDGRGGRRGGVALGCSKTPP